MVSERSPLSEEGHCTQPAGQMTSPAIYNEFTGETFVLDDAYVNRVAEERRVWLERQTLSDDELARRRAQHPDQAWFWTPEWQAKEHVAELDKGGNVARFESDEEFLRSFDELRH